MRTLVEVCPTDDVLLLMGVIVLQVTVVLLIAWSTSLALRRSSAAMRYGVWLSALVCVLVAPALSVVAHRAGISLWAVPRPVPSAAAVEPVTHAGEAPAEPEAAPASLRPPPSSAPTVSRTTEVPEPTAPVAVEHVPRPVPSPAVAAAPVRPVQAPSPVAPAASQTEASSRADLFRAGCVVAGVVWLVGAALLAVRLIHGLGVATLLRRSARPLSREPNRRSVITSSSPAATVNATPARSSTLPKTHTRPAASGRRWDSSTAAGAWKNAFAASSTKGGNS